MTKPINEEKVTAKHAAAVEKEKDLQAKMRRAFNAWNKQRETVDRYERQLEKAAAERLAKARPKKKTRTISRAPSSPALPQLDDMLPPETLAKILP